MSDARIPDHADAVPSADELERTAIPAAIRHAPRLGRFLGTGIGFGILLGVVLGLALPNSTGAGRGIVVVLLSAGFALIGGLIAGVIATRVDKPVRNESTQPLFPQDAIPTAKVATRDGTDGAASLRAQAPDASADQSQTELPNGETT